MIYIFIPNLHLYISISIIYEIRIKIFSLFYLKYLLL